MITKNFLIIFIATSFFYGCIKREHKEEKPNYNFGHSEQYYTDLENKIIKKGDTIAFNELYNFYYPDGNFEERTDSIMRYSKIMVDKYDYKEGYIIYLIAFLEKNDVYFDGFEKLNLNKLNYKSKKEAKLWIDKMLKKGYITDYEYRSIKW